MQTLKLTIAGEYYDSQLYRGRLYLWTMEDSILILDWDKIIANLALKINDHLRLALICAFQKSEYLYGEHLIFQDTQIRQLLEAKFNELGAQPLELSASDITKYLIAEQDNPLPFPHADSTIFSNQLFVGSQKGVSAVDLNHGKRNKPLDSSASLIWQDGHVLSLAASYATLAFSAGEAGLFEYPLAYGSYFNSSDQITNVSDEYSGSINWLYASLFSSSYYNSGYLADYKYDRKKEKREPQGIISADEIFGQNPLGFADSSNFIAGDSSKEYTWGVRDKICRAAQGRIYIAQYTNHKQGQNSLFHSLGAVDITEDGGDIVSANSATFGYVIERDEGLLVVSSSMEENIWLPGEPVNWRIFPRSRYYINQLHIIYDDRLEIYSFNHDYFVDQTEKRVGIRPPEFFPRN